MSLSLPAGTAASGSLRRPISQSRHQGNDSWRAGRLARPGPPSPRPLPWGGVPEGRGGGRGGRKVRPTPNPSSGGEGARAESTWGPSSQDVGGPQPLLLGRTPAAAQVALRSGTLFLEASLWQPSRVPSLPRAHSQRGRGTPPPHTADLQQPSLPPCPSLCQAYSEWGSQVSPGGTHLGCSPSLGPPGWLSEDPRVLMDPPWSRLTPRGQQPEGTWPVPPGSRFHS